MMERTPAAISEPEGVTDIWRWIRYEFGAIVRLIARSDIAFIAAINGPAAGVGLAWALTCDLAIASERARIVPAFGRLGLLPEVGTSWAHHAAPRLPGRLRLLRGGRAHRRAPRAASWASCTRSSRTSSCSRRAEAWCARIAALPAHAIAMTKPLLRAAADGSWESALAMEEFAEPQCFTTRRLPGRRPRDAEGALSGAPPGAQA